MSTRPTARQQAREQTMQRILEISRTQLETHGVAGLSLREVTRELGMVSSAVYRYVAGRDELLTLLLVDAYEDLANTVDAALAAPRGPAPVDPPVGSATASDPVDPSPSPRPARERLLTLALAMRDWAVAHRAQWTLLYGTPVAEYHAPAEATTAPGTRVIGRVLESVVGAQDGGAARAARRPPAPSAPTPRPRPAPAPAPRPPRSSRPPPTPPRHRPPRPPPPGPSPRRSRPCSPRPGPSSAPPRPPPRSWRGPRPS